MEAPDAPPSLTVVAGGSGGWVKTVRPTLSAALTVRPDDHPVVARPPLLSNGCVGWAPHLSAAAGLDTSSALAALPTGSGHDAHDWGAAEDGFHPLRVRLLLGPEADGHGEHRVHACAPNGPGLALDMSNATLTVPLEVRAPAGTAQIVHSVRALQHLPSCAMHTVDVQLPASVLFSPGVAGTVVLAHDLRAPSWAAQSARFGSEVLLAPPSGNASAAGDRLPVFLMTGSCGTGRVAAASCYLPDDGCAHLVQPAGMHEYPGGGSAAAWLRLLPPEDAAIDAGAVISWRVHILTGMAAQASPDVITRTLVAQVAAGLTPGASAELLLQRHTAAWSRRWRTNVSIDAKSGLDPLSGDAASLQRAQSALRFAMFNVHSLTREHGALLDPREVFPSTGAVGGALFRSCLLPVMAPSTSRAAVTARAKELPYAAADAQAYGLDGALLSAGGPAGRRDPRRARKLHVGLLEAVSAWDTYRSTKDRAWLADSAMPLLRAVAGLVCSAVAPSPSSGLSLPCVAALDDGASVAAASILAHQAVSMPPPPADAADHAITVAAAVMALRGATEACHALGVPPDPTWDQVRAALRVPLIAAGVGTAPFIVGRNSGPTSATPVALLEPLLLLSLPSSRSSVFGPDAMALGAGPDLSAGMLQGNVQFWAARSTVRDAPVRTDGPRAAALRALNALILCGVEAMQAQYGSGTAKFQARLSAFLTAHEDNGGWGCLAATPGGLEGNDLGLSALLLHAVVHGLGGVEARGGVTEGQLEYEPLGLRYSDSAVLPPSWARLRLQGMGGGRLDFVATNQLLFAAPGAGGLFASWTVSPLAFFTGPRITGGLDGGGDAGLELAGPAEAACSEVSKDRVRVTWGGGGGYVYAKVTWAPGGGSSPAVAAGTNTFVAAGLAPSTAYTFTVTGYDSASAPLLDGPAPPTANAVTLSVPPQALAAHAVEPGRVRVTWSGGSSTRLQLSWMPVTHAPGASSGVVDVPGQDMAYVVAGLPPNTRFAFRAFGSNGAGVISDQGVVAEATTLPSPPANVRPTIVARTSATIQWDPSPHFFRARVNAYKEGFASPVETSELLQHHECTVRALQPDTSYVLVVTALNEELREAPNGASDAPGVAVTTLGSSPQAVTAANVSEEAATIRWEGGTYSAAKVTWALDDGLAASSPPLPAFLQPREFTARELEAGRTYAFRVIALNRDGVPDTQPALLHVSTLARAPEVALALDVTDSSVTIGWLGGAYHTVVVAWAGGQADAVPSSATTCSVTGLEPGETYVFRVLAYNADGVLARGDAPDVSVRMAVGQ